MLPQLRCQLLPCLETSSCQPLTAGAAESSLETRVQLLQLRETVGWLECSLENQVQYAGTDHLQSETKNVVSIGTGCRHKKSLRNILPLKFFVVLRCLDRGSFLLGLLSACCVVLEVQYCCRHCRGSASPPPWPACPRSRPGSQQALALQNQCCHCCQHSRCSLPSWNHS
jgi:hypothetical protein